MNMMRSDYIPRFKNDLNQVFKEEHLLLIRKIVWSFHRTTGLDFDELFSEACYHYCRACDQWNKEKHPTMTSYVFPIINSGLMDFIQEEQEWRAGKGELTSEGASTPVYEYWSDLSGDILEIVKAIQDKDDEIAELPPKMTRGVIRDHLRDQGWTWPRIWEAIRNTKKTLNETEIGGIIY